MKKKKTVNDIIASLYTFGLHPDTSASIESTRPSAIWSVPASAKGLKKLKFKLPDNVTKSRLTIPDGSEFTTKVTPIETISGWHATGWI